MKMFRAVSCIVTVGAVLLTCVATQAQQPNPTEGATTGPVVKLNLVVVDSDNRTVDKIQKEDVTVIENKLEQQILSFEADERPLDIAIAIDSSGSFKDIFAPAIEAAKVIINNRRPQDEIFIERFISSDKIQKVQEFTTDNEALLKGLDTLIIEGGQSAVVDAVYLAGNHLAQHKGNEDRRKALVLLTDGEDRMSYYKLDDVIKLLREKGIQVYLLAVTQKLQSDTGFIRASPKQRAEQLLNRLANETGGRLFISNTPKELQQSTAEIVRGFQQSFRITYQSSNNSDKKGFRKVAVNVTPSGSSKRKAVTTPGYFYASVKDIPKKETATP